MSIELKEKIHRVIQQKMPQLTDLQAEMMFFSMILRSGELGLDAFGNDKDIQEAYEQYKMWKSLTSNGKVEEDDYSLIYKFKKK